MSSQAGIVAEADNAAYSTSKFALIAWAKALRPAVNREGIAIRIAAPGCTETPLFVAAQEEFARAAGVTRDAFLQRRRDAIPIGCFA